MFKHLLVAPIQWKMEGQDNEVLEFIGDKALDFVVVKQLSRIRPLFKEVSELGKVG